MRIGDGVGKGVLRDNLGGQRALVRNIGIAPVGIEG